MLVNAPSSHTTDFGHRPGKTTVASSELAPDWHRLASESAHRSDFLRRIAAELRTRFKASIVAIHASHWLSPAMLVFDEQMASQIDRDSIKSKLSSIASLPVAWDIQTSTGCVRALGVELTSSPERSAVLVVFPRDPKLSASEQIHSLKQLREITESVSPLILALPISESESSISDQHRQSRSDQSSVKQLSAEQSTTARNPTIHAGDLSRLHLDLDLTATTYRIASESRRLLASDRVSVLTMRRKKFRVSAVSGVAVIDRRSNTVRASERLCRAASVLGRAIVLPGNEDLPPQITEPLDEYLDESGVMTVVLLPLAFSRGNEATDATARDVDTLESLQTDHKQSGMMMLEYFAGPAPAEVSPSMELVRRDATLALRNAIEHRIIFGLPLWKAIGRVVHSNKRLLWFLLAIAMVSAIVAGCLIKIDHQLIATGTIEPAVRRQVYANLDGTVKQLHVQDGELVHAGDVLLQLENAELESQAESIAGEIQTKLQRLVSTRSVRLTGGNDPSRESQLALEQRQLENELENLRAQQQIVKTMQSDLQVRSPIDGRVVAWQLERRLQNRPVGRGNQLLSVVDYDSPWRLNLEVADEDAGTVLAAMKHSETLPIRFAVATEPTRTFDAKLISLSTVSRIGVDGKQVIDAVATVDPSQKLVAELAVGQSTTHAQVDTKAGGRVRVGSSVTAKIVCGRRSVITSWFSDVIDFANRHVLFYFR